MHVGQRCVISCTSDDLDLHSFPTRRSSDLETERDRDELLSRADAEIEQLAALRRAERDQARREARQGALDRSEEHTSELQSLAYLVCRLLLEKKKRSFMLTTVFLLF